MSSQSTEAINEMQRVGMPEMLRRSQAAQARGWVPPCPPSGSRDQVVKHFRHLMRFEKQETLTDPYIVYLATYKRLMKVGITYDGSERARSHKFRGLDMHGQWKTTQGTAIRVERYILDDFWPSIGLSPGVPPSQAPSIGGHTEYAPFAEWDQVSKTAEAIKGRIRDAA
jgi:hypothetical protein